MKPLEKLENEQPTQMHVVEKNEENLEMRYGSVDNTHL